MWEDVGVGFLSVADPAWACGSEDGLFQWRLERAFGIWCR